MFNTKIPQASELPSGRRLLRSTLLALCAAVAILFLFVLPAEYGYDATGLGRALGLTKMGEVKLALQKEAAAASGVANAARTSAAERKIEATGKRGEQTQSLKPGEAVEVKLELKKDARVVYSWETVGGALNFDTHGDPYEDPNGYHRYSKGVMTRKDKGEIKAVFGGWHGWFWRNRDAGPVTVTIRYEGDFISVKKVGKN